MTNPDDLRRRRVRKGLLASCPAVLGVAVAVASAVALFVSTGTAGSEASPSAPHQSVSPNRPNSALMDRYGNLQQQIGGTEVGSQPEPGDQPVGSGWSYEEPSFPSSVPADWSVPSDWSTMVTSALEVFEHETGGGSATLAFVFPQSSSPSQELTMNGHTGQIDHLEGFVEDAHGLNWTMSAGASDPVTEWGGSVVFTGGCTDTPSASGVETCTIMVVEVFTDFSNPYAARIAKWTYTVRPQNP